MPDVIFQFLGISAFLIVIASVVAWARALKRVAIPESRTPFVLLWITGAALAAMALWQGESGVLLKLPAWFAVVVATFLLFLVGISKQKVGDGAIRVGDRIPAFTATDENGELFDSRCVADHLLLIKFFRAHW